MDQYAVVGLGYVGLGLAVALSKKNNVIGFDINENRIQELNQKIDRNEQVDPKELKKSSVYCTSNIEEIRSANFFIVTVSTPAYFYETPDLRPLITAVVALARIIKKGDILVFESTVYPGTTEEICIPILEKESSLVCGKDFFVGYSPERINPGDKHYQLENITKIIGAQDKETLKKIQDTYSTICHQVYPVSSIRVAEAIKILENTQRDVNIAFMNEFAKIMHALDLNVHEIIEGAKTKWSFIPFKPGFVGGHCISIDPHYLAFKAKRSGVQPELILAARKINDEMTHFVIQSLLKILVQHKINLNNATIGVFGISYKENINDVRNSLSLKLIKELWSFGFNCRIHDPLDHHLCHLDEKFSLESFETLQDLTAVIIVVGHDYYRNAGLKAFAQLCKNDQGIVMDVPNLFINEAQSDGNLVYWSL